MARPGVPDAAFRQEAGKSPVDKMKGQVILKATALHKIAAKAITVLAALTAKKLPPQFYTDSVEEAHAWIANHRKAQAA